MPTLSFALELRGHATPVSPGVLLTRASGGHSLFGIEEEALLEGRLSLLDGDSFELTSGDQSAECHCREPVRCQISRAQQRPLSGQRQHGLFEGCCRGCHAGVCCIY